MPTAWPQFCCTRNVALFGVLIWFRFVRHLQNRGMYPRQFPCSLSPCPRTSWRVELASQLQVLGSAHYPHRDFVMYRGGGYGGRGYGGGGYYNSPFRTFINISDLFFYWDPYYSRRQRMMRRESTGPNFFEAIFSLW